eukprot:GEMP01039456.1.p1 GENE.GEMP01039456.1~~GEMP01039456.1.p1  ORF type:complete len:398 (+),score=89.40 GEMP01039456.1:99-1292(+)
MGALAATHRPSSSPLEHAVLRIRAALTSLGHHECHILTHDAALLDEVVCTLERLAATVQARLSCPLSLLGMLPNTCRARVLLMMSDHSDLLMELIFIFPTLAPLLGGASSVALPKSALRAIGRTVSLDEYALRGSPLIFYHIIRHLGSHILQGAASGDLTRRSIANVIWILRFGIEPEAVLRAMSRANYFIRPTLLAYRHREDWEKQIRRSAAVVAFYCGEHAPAGCFAQPSLRVASFFHALDKNRHMPALWLPTGGHCAGGPNAADDTDGACVLFAQLPRPCKVLCLQFLSNLPHVAFELIYPSQLRHLPISYNSIGARGRIGCHKSPYPHNVLDENVRGYGSKSRPGRVRMWAARSAILYALLGCRAAAGRRIDERTQAQYWQCDFAPAISRHVV